MSGFFKNRRIKKIAEKNLELMSSQKESGMEGSLITSTFGRIRSGRDIYFYFDPSDGEIKFFGSSVPRQIKEECFEGCFRIAVNQPFSREKVYTITDYDLPIGIIKEAKKAIELSVQLYNKKKNKRWIRWW